MSINITYIAQVVEWFVKSKLLTGRVTSSNPVEPLRVTSRYSAGYSREEGDLARYSLEIKIKIKKLDI